MGALVRRMSHRHGRAFTAVLLAWIFMTYCGAIPVSEGVAAPRVVERRVTQTTGAEMALGALADLTRVDIDSSGATLLIDDGVESRPLRVELGGLLGVSTGSPQDGAVRFGALAVVAGFFLRAVRTLVRLGRDER